MSDVCELVQRLGKCGPCTHPGTGKCETAQLIAGFVTERTADMTRVANNVIYFDDNSDYRSALLEVCKLGGMDIDDIGVRYIGADDEYE